ncbi:MAG: hypothetical protein IIB83_09405, partial [Bacteroidetes bacterium]|nr:hypothetical protein [Bacteroidota bacterium]
MPSITLTKEDKIEQLEIYERACRGIVSDADDIILQISVGNGVDSKLEYAWGILKEYDCIGPLIAYEFVCDLRYTDILRNATDTCTWCNIGPGAERGLSRMGMPVNIASIRSLYHFSLGDLSITESDVYDLDTLDTTHWIYSHSENSSKDGKVIRDYPYWELREIEHCL